MLCEEIEVRRIKDGEWAVEPLMVAYDETTQTLAIWGKFRPTKNRWAEMDTYRVEPIPVQAPMEGTAFLLHRSAEAVQADKPENRVHRYETLVGPDPEGAKDICSCRGHYGHDRCKHADALRWLIDQMKAPAACDKCGATDCELVGGVCRDCDDAEPEAPDFAEQSFAEWALS